MYIPFMKRFSIAICIILIVPGFVSANSTERKTYSPVSRPHGWEEVLLDFTIIYVFLWGAYAVTQPDTITGISFETLAEGLTDKGIVFLDETPWYTNYLGHPYAGSEYYLYFRARGYSPKMAALHMTISSTLFEFAVEGFGHPPSGIDLLVTPVGGLPLGWAREKYGLKLVNSDIKYRRVLGRIVYPETNFWTFEDISFNVVKSFEYDYTGLAVRCRF